MTVVGERKPIQTWEGPTTSTQKLLSILDRALTQDLCRCEPTLLTTEALSLPLHPDENFNTKTLQFYINMCLLHAHWTFEPDV